MIPENTLPSSDTFIWIAEYSEAVKVPPAITFLVELIFNRTEALPDPVTIKPPIELIDPVIFINIEELSEQVTVIPAIVL